MIYLGDGTTDVPCMKIVKMFGGNSIAVYGRDNKRQQDTARKLLRQDRVNFVCQADYRVGGPVYEVVTTLIDKIKADNDYHALQRKNRRNGR